jgi:hypothetical protein
MPFWSRKKSAKITPLKPLPELSLFNNDNNDKLNNDSSEDCKLMKARLVYLDKKLKELQEELNKAQLFKKKRNTNQTIEDVKNRIEINRNLYMYFSDYKRKWCDNDYNGNNTNVRNNAAEQMENLETHIDPVGWQRAQNELDELMKRQNGKSGGKRTRKQGKSRYSSLRRRT